MVYGFNSVIVQFFVLSCVIDSGTSETVIFTFKRLRNFNRIELDDISFGDGIEHAIKLPF